MREQLELLLGYIERLEKQHRAGLNPSFGEVETLFEQGREMRALLSSGNAVEVLDAMAASPAAVAPPVTRPFRSTRVIAKMAGGTRVIVESRLPQGCRSRVGQEPRVVKAS